MQLEDEVSINATSEVPQPDLVHVGKSGQLVDNVGDWWYVQGKDFGVWYPESALTLIKQADYGGWQKAGKKF